MTKLEAIGHKAATNLVNLISDAHVDILAAWDGCIAEAQAQETKPKLKLSYAITLDLDKNCADYDLSFGVRHKLSLTSPIPDPAQATLPLETSAAPASVTLKTDKGSVTAPLGVFRDAVRQMRAATADDFA